MSDVKIAVGLGRKTGLETTTVFTFLEVAGHDLFDKIKSCFGFLGFVFGLLHIEIVL